MTDKNMKKFGTYIILGHLLPDHKSSMTVNDLIRELRNHRNRLERDGADVVMIEDIGNAGRYSMVMQGYKKVNDED